MSQQSMPTPTTEQLTSLREQALKCGEFVAYYQPQYNHSTKMLLGAEALVRWNSPEFGLLPPTKFISLFEKDGFITEVDLAVFGQVCRFQHRCIDSATPIIPISVNLSARDLSSDGILDKLEEIRTAYNVPPRYLHLELTESTAAENEEQVSGFLEKAHKLGYQIEMDDFGSGYSSLNVLKELDFDLIKLDMRFFSGDIHNRKSGIIISSVIRMCQWLSLPVIAEGIETVQQADFLKSVGCDYIQGYLYSKPITEGELEKKLYAEKVGSSDSQFELIATMDAEKFWSPESLETLIFSNYVGAAAIFEYYDDVAEIIRVNSKFYTELGINISDDELFSKNILKTFDGKNRRLVTDTLNSAASDSEERECEVWATIRTGCCGEEKLCLRLTMRKLGQSPIGIMFYVMLRNITAEKQRYDAILDSERRFKMASEQVNIYYWEYDVATKEMRPCFRCMRDLHLPALVQNYPEPAIECGIFPPDYADMYRDWHRQIEQGVPKLEAVIPLTVGRVPFLVRYTTEFDDFGHPVKAYGSAALVVDSDEQKSEDK